jgi:hypothetical protein
MICKNSSGVFYSTLNSFKWMKNKKVMRFESRTGPKRKKRKKNRILYVGNLIFLLDSFSLFIFLCTSNMISRTWSSIPIMF